MPPGSRQANPAQSGQSGQNASPAYTMAARIRNEQGRERAAEYLAAMEPFLARGEREHIAQSLGLPQTAPRTGQQQPVYQQPPVRQQAPQQQYAPPPYQQSPFSAPQQNDPMQLLQMLSGMGGMGGMGGGANPFGGGKASNSPLGGNPMMLAQLLGGLMGKK